MRINKQKKALFKINLSIMRVIKNNQDNKYERLKSQFILLVMETNKQKGLSKDKYMPPGSYLWKLKQQFINTGVPALFTTTLLAPLERWRIIKQTQKFYPLRPKKFNNILDYIQRIPKQQGLMAFWRGNNAAAWIYVYQVIFQIGVYDSIKHLNKQVNQQTKQTPELSYIFDNVLFPMLASFVTLGIIHPLDTFRIHRSMSFHLKQSDAVFTKFRHRRSQIQLKTMYNGFILANLISLINFNLYKNLFTLLDKAQSSSTTDLTDLTNYTQPQIRYKQVIFSVLAVALVHPLDTFKKIYQLNNLSKPVMFQGYRGVIRYIKENKLESALFNGMGASVTRTVLFAPIYWQVLKIWRSQLNPSEPRKAE